VTLWYNPKHMDRAVALSFEGMRCNCGGPFGCVIVHRDPKTGRETIIGWGYNEVPSTNDWTKHAEMAALRRAARWLKKKSYGQFGFLTDCDVYVNAHPCTMCEAALLWARPRRIYYVLTKRQAGRIGFADQRIENHFRKPPERRRYRPIHVHHRHAAKAFREWERKRDKVRY